MIIPARLNDVSRAGIITLNAQILAFFLNLIGFIFGPMKWLACICFFILLTVSWIPCTCDEDRGMGDITVQKMESQKQDDHKTDNCNPFCSCSCSPNSILYQNKGVEMTPGLVFFIPRKFAEPEQNVNSYNAHSIWQPPKLG